MAHATVLVLVLVVAALYVVDHPRMLGRYRDRTMRLDTAWTDEDALRDHLQHTLDARVVTLSVKHLDVVNDTTLVEVRYVVPARRGGPDRRGARRGWLVRGGAEPPDLGGTARIRHLGPEPIRSSR